MADPKELPEGTDAVIAGASTTENEEALIVREPTTRDKAIEKFKGSTDKLSGQAADKARELVGQGLERGGEALANVSKMVGDTATSLDERPVGWTPVGRSGGRVSGLSEQQVARHPPTHRTLFAPPRAESRTRIDSSLSC